MLLELSEVLACPRCGPPQVMVAVVHESVGYRVTSGFLGCPTCDSRFPIEESTVHLQRQEPGEQPEASAPSPVSLTDESAMLIGAVLDLEQGSGHVLLGPELSEVADAVAALAERWEVVSLCSVRPAHAAPVHECQPNRPVRRRVPARASLALWGGRAGRRSGAGSSPAVRGRASITRTSRDRRARSGCRRGDAGSRTRGHRVRRTGRCRLATILTPGPDFVASTIRRV